MRAKALTVAASLLAATVFTAARSTFAHHSWSAEYDLSRSTVVSGTVARVLIRNPHSAVLLDVDHASGRPERWTVEWASPQRLRDRGITEGTIRSGETLLVTGNPHRDAAVRSLRAVTLRRADGTEVGETSPPARTSPRPGVPSTGR